jgi:hypothetical protein
MDAAADRWAAWAEVALANIDREYPHGLQHTVIGPQDRQLPHEMHPAFYGSFDWHSCVEMHWLLVRLLRVRSADIPVERVRAGLAGHLTAEALGAEAAYVAARPTWERPYGWGWALALAEELHRLPDDAAGGWRSAIEPLVRAISRGLQDWLAKADFPIRHGVHANSAFGLARSLGWARIADPALAHAIEDAARRWFGGDADYPAHYEPSGADFLSPALTEAELMGMVLPAGDFGGWLDTFLPGLGRGEPGRLFEPVRVTDPSDGYIAHLHGLNLSRAYGFRRIAGRLAAADPRRRLVEAAVDRHAAASLTATVGSDYMVEHWLAAYAVLLLT